MLILSVPIWLVVLNIHLASTLRKDTLAGQRPDLSNVPADSPVANRGNGYQHGTYTVCIITPVLNEPCAGFSARPHAVARPSSACSAGRGAV